MYNFLWGHFYTIRNFLFYSVVFTQPVRSFLGHLNNLSFVGSFLPNIYMYNFVATFYPTSNFVLFGRFRAIYQINLVYLLFIRKLHRIFTVGNDNF